MFVFTVTEVVSGRVYVASARDSIEAQWAQIVAAAESGQAGELFALIRSRGPGAFELEEWAVAENSRELRELIAEARESLGAEIIRMPRIGASAKSSRSSVSAEIRALFEQAEEELAAQAPDELIKTEAVSKPEPREVKAEPNGPLEVNAGDRKPAESPMARERRLRQAIADEREQRAALRQQQASAQAKEMRDLMAQIEQRRQAQRKTPPKKKKTSLRSSLSAKPPKAESTVAEPAVKARPKDFTPSGKAAREKRIKEAIALEKAEQQRRQQAVVASQADEMAELLKGLDARAKSAASYKRKL